MSTTQLVAPNVSAQHWADPSHPDDRPFIRRYIFSTDHKVIGCQFMMLSLFFLPIWTGMEIPRWYLNLHFWFPTWI